LEKDAEYMRQILKGKDERIEDLNRECEGLREQVFQWQERELRREEEYKERELRREEEYKERELQHQQDLETAMRKLSISEQERKRCQDVLCEIALLTPAERKELADLFAATRAKMDPFLSQ